MNEADRRYGAFLRLRYRNILGYTALVCALIGLLIALPATLVAAYPEEKNSAWLFAATGLLLIALSLGLWRRFCPREKDSLSLDEGAAVVVLSWMVAILAGAVPFLGMGLDWTRAVFEATSGWTTTGLSVIDVERASPLILFFRSLMQLAGGAGLAIIMLSALTGPAGVSLSTAEGRAEQLVANVRQSARLVLFLYGAYVTFGVAALKLCGLSWFDAVNHAFCALSTGGFSTRPESIGAWRSPAVEGVTILLMLLGMTNFLIGYALWRGDLRTVARNGEMRLQALLLPFLLIALYGGVTLRLDAEPAGALRAALFQAVSALSTTGYATVDPREWNSLGWALLLMAMLIGGGAGSTAGGLKLYRVHALARGLLWQLRAQLSPRGLVNQPALWVGEQRRVLDDAQLRQLGLYAFLYLGTWLAGGCALAAYGHPLADSLFEFASSLGTVGLSVGLTSAAAPDGQLWIQIGGMILGRLEFFVVFAGLLKLGRDLPLLLGAGARS
ncbi:TrkH family potassium uptake protein [Geoalkalibacter sp.]|uniref:TrkH family potassium uptake protein n=1 Tax=Geoalkalibacter sp. TaxID=3041440 RepID=UPI00272E2C5E|nr:potassium transporter TrkG [Geoalkalibacter sp.]